MEYKLDIPKLSAPPEVRIGDRIYQINNRRSAVSAIDKRLKSGKENEIDVILEVCLGAEALKEITAADYPMPVMNEISLIIRAALMGLTLEEARAQFRKNG